MKREMSILVSLLAAAWVLLYWGGTDSQQQPAARKNPVAMAASAHQAVPPATSTDTPTVRTAVLGATSDSYVDSGNPGANNGIAAALNVGMLPAGQTGRALLSFDLTSLAGATVRGASLELFRSGGSTSPPSMDVGLYRITESWGEGSVVWGNEPAATGIGKVNPVGLESAYYQWDIRDLVQEWVNGTFPNYGVMLRAEPETVAGWRGFNSRENSLSAPRLVISYTVTISTSDPQVQGLRRLEANSQSPVQARFRNGIPRFIRAQVPTGGTAGDPLSQARGYLTAYNDLYRITDVMAQFRLDKRASDSSGSHLAFQQLHNGVPVFGSDVRLHISNTVLSSASAAYLPELSISTVPSITLGTAETAALRWERPRQQPSATP